jgi:molybdenum cofactor cytidylyltransferase
MNGRAQSFKIVVLAAGYSERLGKPKALARIHGVCLLRRTLLLAAAVGTDQILAIVPPRSARYRAEARRIEVRFVENHARAVGISSSVRLATARARFSNALLFLPVDLAQLNVRDLKRLIASWRHSPQRITATAFGGSGGIPLILPRRYYRHVAELQGDAGLRRLLDHMPGLPLRRVNIAAAAFDVDTPQQLSRARQRWSALLA